MPPKCFKNILILCFERRFSKQNSIIRLKSNKIKQSNNFGLATPLVSIVEVVAAVNHLVASEILDLKSLQHSGL